jgi:hypothetical protein
MVLVWILILYYIVPYVVDAFPTEAKNITIRGGNFGPDREFNNSTDVIMVNGTMLCTPYIVNHSYISCNLEDEMKDGAYYVDLVIAGYNASVSFEYGMTIIIIVENKIDNQPSFSVRCQEPCVNGVCSGFSECDCTGTGYEGPLCETKRNNRLVTIIEYTICLFS